MHVILSQNSWDGGCTVPTVLAFHNISIVEFASGLPCNRTTPDCWSLPQKWTCSAQELPEPSCSLWCLAWFWGHAGGWSTREGHAKELELLQRLSVRWGEVSYILEAAKPASSPPSLSSMQASAITAAPRLQLGAEPSTGGKWNLESLCWALQSPLVSQAENTAEHPGLGYQGWLLPPSMLLRSSHHPFVGVCGGPAEICATFWKNVSDANTLCQRAYGVRRRGKGCWGIKCHRHEKRNALGHRPIL